VALISLYKASKELLTMVQKLSSKVLLWFFVVVMLVISGVSVIDQDVTVMSFIAFDTIFAALLFTFVRKTDHVSN
jgi:hypothetical protein